VDQVQHYSANYDHLGIIAAGGMTSHAWPWRYAPDLGLGLDGSGLGLGLVLCGLLSSTIYYACVR